MNQLDFDPLNVQLKDLRPGFFTDYNYKTYQITAGFEYLLKNKSFKLLQLDSGDELIWILIENGTNTYIVESKNLAVINSDLPGMMSDFKNPPQKIDFKEEGYYFNDSSDGKFRDMAKNAMDWNRCTCWLYSNEEGNSYIYALQKGAGTFEGLLTKQTNSAEFMNFIPKI